MILNVEKERKKAIEAGWEREGEVELLKEIITWENKIRWTLLQ